MQFIINNDTILALSFVFVSFAGIVFIVAYIAKMIRVH